MNSLEPTLDFKKIIRGHFVDFLKQSGKGVSNSEFELLSKFENYLVERIKTNETNP